MEILNQLKPSETRTSIALGFFDGMHRGHQTVIKSAVTAAGEDMIPSVLTFYEQPRAVISGKTPELLINDDEKIKFFERIGVKRLYCLHFKELSDLSPEDFVEFVLLRTLNAKRVFCGFNYHFGKGGTADCDELKRLCRLHNIILSVNNPVLYQGYPISSSRIRDCVRDGDMISACIMLGRCFSYYLPVIKGNQLGRQLGAPTINQDISDNQILPRFGVYATFTTIDGVRIPSVTNVGIKPTVGSDKPIAETWILSDDIHDMYGKNVEVSFIKFIRGEKKFETLEDLKDAISADAKRAKLIFNAYFN